MTNTATNAAIRNGRVARDGDDARAQLAEAKRTLRWKHWNALREAGGARFPGAVGRVPNFVGAEAAAERFTHMLTWQRARVVLCNPDLAQRPVRAKALREGKVVVMAVPRLAAVAPFVRLDPERASARPWELSSIRVATERGEPLSPEDVEPVDLVVVGSVAVAADGTRLGKGGGFDDLAIALLAETGAWAPRVPIWTTVHDSAVVRPGTIPVAAHDRRVDGFLTPTTMVPCDKPRRERLRWDWSLLSERTRREVPCVRGFPRLEGEADATAARRRKA